MLFLNGLKCISYLGNIQNNHSIPLCLNQDTFRRLKEQIKAGKERYIVSQLTFHLKNVIKP